MIIKTDIPNHYLIWKGYLKNQIDWHPFYVKYTSTVGEFFCDNFCFVILVYFVFFTGDF